MPCRPEEEFAQVPEMPYLVMLTPLTGNHGANHDDLDTKILFRYAGFKTDFGAFVAWATAGHLHDVGYCWASFDRRAKLKSQISKFHSIHIFRAISMFLWICWFCY